MPEIVSVTHALKNCRNVEQLLTWIAGAFWPGRLTVIQSGPGHKFDPQAGWIVAEAEESGAFCFCIYEELSSRQPSLNRMRSAYVGAAKLAYRQSQTDLNQIRPGSFRLLPGFNRVSPLWQYGFDILALDNSKRLGRIQFAQAGTGVPWQAIERAETDMYLAGLTESRIELEILIQPSLEFGRQIRIPKQVANLTLNPKVQDKAQAKVFKGDLKYQPQDSQICITGVQSMTNSNNSAEITLSLGAISIPMQEFLQLRAGSTLRVNLPEVLEGKVCINQCEWASAQIEVQADELVVTIDQLAILPRAA